MFKMLLLTSIVAWPFETPRVSGLPAAGVFTTSVTAPFFQSNAANPADTGVFRLGTGEKTCWENSASGTDICETYAGDATNATINYSPTNSLKITATDSDTYINFNDISGVSLAHAGTAGITVTSTVATIPGTFTSTNATNIGWTPVSGADTACNTTCTSACVFGFNVVAGNVTGLPLLCTDATADVCICAGSS